MPTGPLAGVRVVELAGIGPAPFAAMVLTELGADVVRIDRPGGHDLGLPAEADALIRGRPSLVVDLKQPRGRTLVLELVDSADVFLEGFRPGVTERLGLGPDAVLARRPSIVYGRMTGWGQSGPRAGTAGHDLTYLAVTGALHAIGSTSTPAIPLNVVGDFGGGAMYLVVGVLAALHAAQITGRGQVVDAAVVDGVAHQLTSIHSLMAAGWWQDRRESNLLDGGAPFYSVYRTSDDRHLAVAPLEKHFYAEFVRLLEPGEPLPDRDDESRWPELRTAIAGRIRQRTLQEWTAVFDGTDACVAPVLSLREAAADPHLAQRGTMTVEGGLYGGAAPRLSVTPGVRTASQVDADVQQTLRRWSVADAEQLIAEGIVVPTEAGRAPQDVEE